MNKLFAGGILCAALLICTDTAQACSNLGRSDCNNVDPWRSYNQIGFVESPIGPVVTVTPGPVMYGYTYVPRAKKKPAAKKPVAK